MNWRQLEQMPLYSVVVRTEAADLLGDEQGESHFLSELKNDPKAIIEYLVECRRVELLTY